jgi:hypothetical protein
VHVITHAALHVPRSLVQEVRRLSHLLGVFILPSGGVLDLEWLDLLESYAVVDHATIEQGAARARAATKIVDDVTRGLAVRGASGDPRGGDRPSPSGKKKASGA